MKTEGWFVAGTGPRNLQLLPQDQKTELLFKIGRHLTDLLDSHDNLVVISGMAEGFDAALATSAVNLGVPWVAAIPTPSYGSYYWGQHSQTGTNRLEDFLNLLMKATETVICSQNLYVDGLHANFYRNQWMVDHADHLLAYDLNRGGTQDCIRRAEAKGIPISRVSQVTR